MFLSIFIHSNYFCQTITQSFYIALSHIVIRTRNILSEGVLIIRELQAEGSRRRTAGSRRNNYTRGRACHEFLKLSKISQCRKLCRKHPIPYLNTCITYLNTLTRLSAPYLNTCIAYLNTLTRLSAPYLSTCIAHLNTLTRLSALGSIS